MRQVLAVAMLCIGVGQVVAAAETPAAERLVHRFLGVEISPAGDLIASVEGESSKSGGAPTVRDLVIRNARSGAATTIAMPCGRVPQCWPDSPTWSPDGKRVSFALRTPGTHARSLYSVGSDGKGLAKLIEFSGTIVHLRSMPDGRLAMLAIQNANKEVGATQAGAPVAGDLDAAPPEQRIAILENGALRLSLPPICSFTNTTGGPAARASSARRRPATATTIGGPRSSMPFRRTGPLRASFTLRPTTANSWRCRKHHRTGPRLPSLPAS